MKEERTFVCADCGHTFTRRDSLKRHAAGHEDTQGAQVDGLERRISALEERTATVRQAIADMKRS